MSIADLEEIFQRGTEEIDDHDVVVALLARVHNPGHAWTAHEGLVDFGLLAEGRREGPRYRWLELDCDFFARYGVNAEEDGAYTTDEMARTTCARTRCLPQPPLAISSSSLYFPPNVTSMACGRGRDDDSLWGFWFILCKQL